MQGRCPENSGAFRCIFKLLSLQLLWRTEEDYSGSFLWPFLYVFRLCRHGCIAFPFFPKKKGKFMLHFLPHCVRLLRHLLALTAHFWPVWEVFLWIMYIYIYTYAWWLMFLGGSSFPPFLSTPFAVFAGYVSLFWIDTGVWNSSNFLSQQKMLDSTKVQNPYSLLDSTKVQNPYSLIVTAETPILLVRYMLVCTLNWRVSRRALLEWFS